MLDLYCRPQIRFVTVGLIIDLVPAVNSLIGLPPAFIVHSFALKKKPTRVGLTSSKGSLIIVPTLPRAFKPHQPATAISTNVGT